MPNIFPAMAVHTCLGQVAATGKQGERKPGRERRRRRRRSRRRRRRRKAEQRRRRTWRVGRAGATDRPSGVLCIHTRPNRQFEFVRCNKRSRENQPRWLEAKQERTLER